MMGRSIGRAAFTAVTFLTALVGGFRPALAHEEREIGRWRFVVGWGDEPAYAGFKNGVLLLLSNSAGTAVTDLGDTLKVEVSLGSEKTTLVLEPNFEVGEFGTPGDYRAWVIPTRPGSYSFHFLGTIKGDKIDATFSCSEGTFDCVKGADEAQFPAKDPTAAQIADRLDREFPRAARKIASVVDDADSARLLGIIGIAVGGLGLATAVAALARRRPERTG
jgi:hypothetical protein